MTWKQLGIAGAIAVVSLILLIYWPPARTVLALVLAWLFYKAYTSPSGRRGARLGKKLGKWAKPRESMAARQIRERRRPPIGRKP